LLIDFNIKYLCYRTWMYFFYFSFWLYNFTLFIFHPWLYFICWVFLFFAHLMNSTCLINFKNWGRHQFNEIKFKFIKKNNLKKKDMLKNKNKKNKWSPFHFRQKKLHFGLIVWIFGPCCFHNILILNFVCLLLQSLSLTNRKENHKKKKGWVAKKIIFFIFQ
jgi:hypothetical protein